MSSAIVFTIVILVSIITVLGDYFIKLSGNSAEKFIDWWRFGVGLFFYLLTAFGWFFIMKYMKLSTIGITYGITTAILLVAIGLFVFKETLNSYEILGICFGIAALILLSRFAS